MRYYARSVLLVFLASLAIAAGTVVAAHAEKLANISELKSGLKVSTLTFEHLKANLPYAA